MASEDDVAAKTLAIIEADHQLINHVDNLLQEQGFRVFAFSDGDVIEFVRSCAPSLILLSVELARSNGYSLCNRIKKQPDLRRIPLILTSTDATPEAFAQHQKTPTPADGYLHKPFSDADLLALIEQCSKNMPASDDTPSAISMPNAAAPTGSSLVAPNSGFSSLAAAASVGAGSFAHGASDTDSQITSNSVIVAAGSGSSSATPPRRPPPLPSTRRSMGPSLDELLLQNRADEPALAAPSASAGPEAKITFLRETLKRRESDLAKSRELWGQRERELAQLQDALDAREKELDRAKRAREDLLGQLTHAEDRISSLYTDLEINKERTERLDKERQALSDSLEELENSSTKRQNQLSQNISDLERLLAKEQENRAQEKSQSEASIAELSSMLDQSRAELAQLAEEHANLRSESNAQIAELRSLLAASEASAASLHEQLTQRNSEVAQLESTLQELRQQKALLEEKARITQEDLESRIEELSSDKALLETELHETQAIRDEKIRLLEEAYLKISDHEALLTSRQGQITDLDMQLRASQARGDELDVNLAQTQQALSETEQKYRDLDAAHHELSALHGSTSQQLDETSLLLSQTQEQLANTTREAADMETQLRSHIASLEEHTQAIDNDRISLQGTLSERDSTISSLQQYLAQEQQHHQDDNAAFTEQVAALNSQRDELVGELSAAQNQIAVLGADLAAAQAQGQELQVSLSQAKASIEHLNKELSRSEMDIINLREELNAAQDRGDELQARLHSTEQTLQTELAGRAQDREHWELQLQSAQMDLANLQEDLSLSSTRLQQAELAHERERSEREILADRIAGMDETLDAAQIQSEALSDENTRLKTLLKKAQDERDVLKRERAQLQDRLQTAETTLSRRSDDGKRANDMASANEATQAQLVALQQERDEALRKLQDSKMQADAFLKKLNELHQQNQEKLQNADRRTRDVEEQLAREKENAARVAAVAKSQEDMLQARLRDAESRSQGSAAEQMVQLNAMLQERDERINKLSTDLVSMRDKARQAIATAKALDERLRSSGDGREQVQQLRERYNEAVQRLQLREQQYTTLAHKHNELAARYRQLHAYNQQPSIATVAHDDDSNDFVGDVTLVVDLPKALGGPLSDT